MMGKMKNIVKQVLVAVICLLCWQGGGSADAMSLNVQNGDIGELLRSIARMGNLNIILDRTVTGSVSLKVDEAEPEEMLRQIVRAGGFAMTREGNTWIVAGQGNLQQGFGRVHVIPVKYAPLSDIQRAVAMCFEQGDSRGEAGTVRGADSGAKVEGKSEADGGTKSVKEAVKRRQRVLADVSTGSLMVYGTEEEAEKARELVQKLDVPAKQVSIEAKVVSVNKEDASKLGIQWDWTTLPQYNYNGDEVSRPVFDRSGTAGGVVSFGKGPDGKPYEWQFSAAIEAMVSHGKADVLSRPNIVTMQGQEAVINIGGEVPVPTVSTTNSTVTTSIEYRPAGIILRCLPMVNEDGCITSKIHTEVSAPQYVEEMNAYSFQKRSADTMVRLKDGETMVIGGLISSEEIKSMSKVPFLGDLPVLGNLFKSVHSSVTNSEIFIILKAKIVS